MVLVAVAVIARGGDDPGFLTVQPRGLQFQRPLERLSLMAKCDFVGMRRIGALDRIPQQDEQLHAGQVTGDPLRRQGVKHIIRAGFKRRRSDTRGTCRAAGDSRQREVTPVPGEPPAIFVVEVVNFLI